MTRLYCDGPTLLRAVASAIANLERHVDEVDALNVFPVPDGDTGSNMLATMRAALTEAERLPADGRSLKDVADALSRGALTGARGNSGVILSQIIRGMTDGANGRRRATGLDLAQGLRRGSEVAYGSVLTPVEGTILTVIRDAAEAAESAAGRQPHVEAVLAETIEAAAGSVRRTPTLLPVLQDAGVVDSGGQGLYRLLEGTMQLDGQLVADPVARPSIADPVASGPAPPVSGPAPPMTTTATSAAPRPPDGSAEADHAHDGHGYETEFVIRAGDGRLDIEAIRAELQAVGESLVVAGDDQLARVHLHGHRPDLAIGIGVRWGRLSDVVMTDLDEQVAARPSRPDESQGGQGETEAPSTATALLAVADAEGLAAILEGLGARVVRPAQGSRPSVGEIAGAILASGASEVVVLPNDRDAHLAAGQAASLTPLVAVSVIPTRNVAEGVAAALAFDPDAELAANAETMEAEAGNLRSFAVTTAVRDSVVEGVEVKAGDVIALDAGRRVLAQERSVEAAALRALEGLAPFELVSCYHGADRTAEDVAALRASIVERHPETEVEMVPGGQRHQHLLVSVE